MKFTTTKEQIIEGLQKAAAIIPAKAGGASLRSIWLKAEESSLAVMSTDANIEFTGRYPAEISQPGLIGVQGRTFADLVRQLPAGVLNFTLDETSGNLLLEQGRRVYKLPVSVSEWFQNLSEFPAENAVTWSGDFLQDVLDKVGFCISDDDAMDAIACLCMKPGENGHIDVCGLNGHQFALVSFTHDELAARLPAEGMLIQKKYLQDIKKWLGVDEIELNITGKRLYLRSLDGAETLSLPRATCEYPDYNIFMSKLADEGISAMTLDRKESMDALGRILIFNTESDYCTYMDLSENEARLSAQGQDVGSASESLEVAYRGDITRIAFPTRDLMEVFGHFVSGKIDMLLAGTEGPCGIRGAEDPDYTVIIMPMKVSETTYYSEEDV
ncbi:DNA polymerase III subunit beta [uncultured Desulfovibrio sp.]|uniref:DNA polymerase III subunit beta n=1 Tax=uncultured Desulfovibrio sp. TaxID=167968 RepID=UPI00039DAE23|nr:DNA polymerase III subunit beta [uncultured Desulfovibrio sp.]